jgi:CubicO group peptidase (beta-lactamase class C family)
MAAILKTFRRNTNSAAACLGVLLALMPCPLALAQDAEQPPPAESASSPPSEPPSAPPPTDAEKTAPAEVPPAGSAEQPPPRNGPTDRAELEAFVDGIMAVHLKDKHIAGATIAVVVDNKLFFAKGYGLADVERKKPVNPDETMFRIGSVSKLFTWTAVMQLVEQGKLDLDADINQYLREFKIPPTFARPITLKDLLAHTPGFEDHVIGLFAHGPEKISPLGQLLARDLPTRVRPPGEVASYSNHGTALAGYIVAEVAGVPWEEYIERNILEPLAMSHTTVRQPAADKLPAEMSKGYKFEGGQYKEQGFEYVPPAPAGSMSASAADMAKFMIAHLQNGASGDARILKEETARRMRELLFTHDPRLCGMAYGFMRMKYNGLEIVEHGGDTFWFHSEFVMLPQKNAGVFASYNTNTVGKARQQLLEAFLDRYYPALDAPAKKPLAGFHERAPRYTGSYRMNRYSHTTPAKLGALLGVYKVSAEDDTLELSGLGQGPKRFVEVEPLVFCEIDGQDKLAFREDASGRITQFFADGIQPIAFDRLSWYETPEFVIGLFVGCVAVLVSALVGWPFAAFLTRGGRAVDAEPTAGSRLASWVAWTACLAILAWLAVLAIPMSDSTEIAYGMPPVLDVLLKLSPFIPALVGVVFLCALLAWKNGFWRLSARLHYTCVLVAGVALVWLLNHWNLLRFGA